MTLTIELLPDPAANDLRLIQLAAQRRSPLNRLNLLHGSALQRLSTQRMLTEANDGALAAVYGFTPVDLAQVAAQFGEPPDRQSWPSGTDLATLRHVLGALPLQRLDPDAPGVPSALLRTLTDLREAAISPNDLPPGDLATVFSAWTETVAASADRTSRYEDAIRPATTDSSYREALGEGPLIVSGLYDLTRIQQLLLARLARATDVHMLLVAPSDDPASPPQRTLAALRREINPRVIQSPIAPTPFAPDRYFSAGDPTAEADELASRILQHGREGVAFHRVAVLHQQGAPGDDRICAALERAGIPSWRIGGRRLANTPLGRAAISLVRLLLDPESVERIELTDWLSHRALRERPLNIARRPSTSERVALDAGLTRGLHLMRNRLESWLEFHQTDEANDLAHFLGDLSDRSHELAQADSWRSAVDTLFATIDDYFDEERCEPDLWSAIRDTFEQIRSNDALSLPWSPSDGLTALNRAFGSRVVRDANRLIGGVNVGAATGPVRGIRYHAVFVAGVAERILPAVGRQDPLLTDAERVAINARIPDALALQRDRAFSDRHAWTLARRSATLQFTASWSRRSSAVGGPARPSTLILESAGNQLDPSDRLPSESAESALYRQGRIERVGPSPITDFSELHRATDIPDKPGFRLALLSAPDVDIHTLLPDIWPQAESTLYARRQRSAAHFTEYDGVINPDALADWRPLDQSWSAAALETLIACPYRFYLQEILAAAAVAESDQPDEQQDRTRGQLMRRILSAWAREYLHDQEKPAWFDYTNSPEQLNSIADRIIDSAEQSGVLGPSSTVSSTRREILQDLDHARRRETAHARDGWRPLDVNVAFDDAPVRVTGNRTLLMHGVIDRIDVHADGRQRALRLFSGRTVSDVRGFVNGSSLLAIAALAGLTQRGVPIRQAEVEHRSVTASGSFESHILRGESLTMPGGRSAPSDGERLRETLALIAEQLDSAGFIPYPGHPLRERPNCRRCPFESSCTADVGKRYEHKARQDQDAVRRLEILRRQRI
jgi:hypothetical protein